MTTRYVDNRSIRAADANPGTSATNPLLTLARANALMVSGDRTLVYQGTYFEQVPITVDGAEWQAVEPGVVIDGSAEITQSWTLHSGTIWKCATTPGASAIQSLYVNDRLYDFPATSLGTISPAFEPVTGITEAAHFHDTTALFLYLNLGGLDPNTQTIRYGARPYSFRLLTRTGCVIDGFKGQRTSDRAVLIDGGSGHVVRRMECWQNPGGGIRIEAPRPGLFKPTVTTGTSTLAAGTYYYRVTAMVGGVETIPATFQQITITAGQIVQLSWSAVVGATDYRIYGRNIISPPIQAVGTYMTTVTSAAPFPTYNDTGSATPNGTTQPPFTSTIKSRDNLVEDCETWNNGSLGIAMFGASNNTIRGNRSHHNANHGIGCQFDASNNLIELNRSWLNQKALVRTANGIICDNFGAGTPGSPGNVVQRNICFRNQDSGVSLYNDSTDCIARYNVCYLNGDHGIDNFNALRAHMIGNTVFGCATAGLNSEGGGTGGGNPSLGIRMYNNLSVDNGIQSPRTSGNYRIDALTYVDSEFDYNLSHLTIPAADQTVGSNYEIAYGLNSYKSFDFFQAANPTIMTHGLSVDPQFVDRDNNDYMIEASSPATGVGTTVAPDYVANDYYGLAPAGGPPSMGAYHRLRDAVL